MKPILIIISLLLLTACTNNQTNIENPNTDTSINETPTKPDNLNSDEQSFPTDNQDNNGVDEINYSKFFMPDGSTSYFLGDGNEYATFTVHTKWLSDRYVALTENNGGAVMLKIYRIDDQQNKADQVYNEIVVDFPTEIQYPTIIELENLPTIETYLTGPIEVGTVFGKWKVVQVETTLETPYKNFDNVFILEESTDDYINRKYFVEGFGEVKRESIMHIEGEEDFIVTSTIEKIDEGK